MIQLYYRPSGSQTIAIWPEIDSIYYNNISGSFILDYSQDLDRSSGSIDLTLQNTPDSVSPRLVFSLANANVPQFSGYYTVELFERIGARLATWGETTDTWIAADYTWNATTDIVSSRQLDTDRAWVSGSDDSSFTQYASANEDGQYTTYHG
jgi:hypothetical protein